MWKCTKDSQFVFGDRAEITINDPVTPITPDNAFFQPEVMLFFLFHNENQ